MFARCEEVASQICRNIQCYREQLISSEKITALTSTSALYRQYKGAQESDHHSSSFETRGRVAMLDSAEVVISRDTTTINALQKMCGVVVLDLPL